jgi:hypothetical protein
MPRQPKHTTKRPERIADHLAPILEPTTETTGTVDEPATGSICPACGHMVGPLHPHRHGERNYPGVRA